MKRVNAQGGDKDGFRFVIPKTHRRLMELEEANSDSAGVGGACRGRGATNAPLRSTFLGDAVEEGTDTKPMRRNKRNVKRRDDFYQFQVRQKWTQNAESFLARGKAGKKFFTQRRQNQSRWIKHL